MITKIQIYTINKVLDYLKFALLNSRKIEAKPGLKGQCPSCGSELIPRCGKVKIHHWAHKSVKMCDNWWENETQWHRDWKNHFPVEWQEVVQIAEDGEKHIADVKTSEGWVIEFQHSYLKDKERESRDRFYGSKLVWVVDGDRTKTSFKQFKRALEASKILDLVKASAYRVNANDYRILKDWVRTSSLVLFDFKHYTEDLWLLFDEFLVPINRSFFIELIKETKLNGFYEKISSLLAPHKPNNLEKINKNRLIIDSRLIRVNPRIRRGRIF